jgi:hypothetical protein
MKMTRNILTEEERRKQAVQDIGQRKTVTAQAVCLEILGE